MSGKLRPADPPHPAADGQALFDGSVEESLAMSQNPWWHPSDDDLGWDEPLPVIIRLAPDYSAPVPLWDEGFGNIGWRYTKFPPALFDRLAAWQQGFDGNSHCETGRRSAPAWDRWADNAKGLATDLRAVLGTRAELVVDLWPLDGKPRAVSRIKRGPSRIK